MRLRPAVILTALTLLVACALHGPGRAYAADSFGEIDEISVLDDRGNWSYVDRTGRAHVQREGALVPVTRGMELEEGERIVTEVARLRVRLREGEYIHVWENADITVAERSILQTLGDVYYSLKGRFTVKYGTVETVVEGTRFLVSGPEPVKVLVEEGQVRVNSGGVTRLVQAGQQLSVASGALARPVKVQSRTLLRTMDRSRWLLGGPRARVGFLVGPGADVEGPGLTGRLTGSVGLSPNVGLSLDSGFNKPFSREPRRPGAAGSGAAFPQAAGLELRLGAFSLGGQALENIETWKDECGQTHAVMKLGGAANARVDIPFARLFFVMGGLRAGWAGEPMMNLDLGLGVGL